MKVQQIREKLAKIYSQALRILHIINNMGTESQQIYILAKSLLGKDASPQNLALSELACAESTSHIIHKVKPNFPVVVSTNSILEEMEKRPDFQEIDTYEPLAIIICPTKDRPFNSPLTNGHVGICGYWQIMSNNSLTGKWDTYFTKKKWDDYYEKRGGFKTRYFRILDNQGRKTN